jgi:hypothetical protein
VPWITGFYLFFEGADDNPMYLSKLRNPCILARGEVPLTYEIARL